MAFPVRVSHIRTCAREQREPAKPAFLPSFRSSWRRIRAALLTQKPLIPTGRRHRELDITVEFFSEIILEGPHLNNSNHVCAWPNFICEL